MENLTRNNYEIWFLDYLDGQLSNEQLEILLDFLELNPDLKQELQGVSGTSLAAGMEVLDRKEQLLKTPADIPGISALDQLCIARMENDLTGEEARQFDQRLNVDPELRGNFFAFNHTRLDPADQVLYPYKNELRRKVIRFSPWLVMAISSAAIVLLAWFLWPDPSGRITTEFAKTEQPATNDTKPETLGRPSAIAGNELKGTIPSQQASAGYQAPDDKNPDAVTAEPEKRVSVDIEPREIIPMKSLARKSVLAGPRIPDPEKQKLLFASNYPSAGKILPPAADALTLPQYALQLFRVRILGEDRNQVRKTRFSLWEVAGAGVDKINDLAGTKMKINREYDSTGEIMAVSFNSRLLDIESPVNSRESR